MSKSAYPVQADLEAAMTAAGITVGTLDTATFIAAGISDFEKRVRRKMLAPGQDATRTYDPPTDQAGYLDLVQDLASLTTVVYFPQGALSGETWVQNVDFWVRPYNAAADGKPYLGLELKRRFMSPLLPAMHRSIQVTGRWGYGAGIPEDAWQAMIFRAMALLEPAAGWKLSGGIVRTADTGVDRLYGDDPGKGARTAWETAFEDAVKRYQRWGL